MIWKPPCLKGDFGARILQASLPFACVSPLDSANWGFQRQEGRRRQDLGTLRCDFWFFQHHSQGCLTPWAVLLQCLCWLPVSVVQQSASVCRFSFLHLSSLFVQPYRQYVLPTVSSSVLSHCFLLAFHLLSLSFTTTSFCYNYWGSLLSWLKLDWLEAQVFCVPQNPTWSVLSVLGHHLLYVLRPVHRKYTLNLTSRIVIRVWGNFIR